MKEITRILLAIKSKEPLDPFISSYHSQVHLWRFGQHISSTVLNCDICPSLVVASPPANDAINNFFFLFPLQVLAAMLRWVTHDLNNRTQELKELLNFIRVPFVSSSYLKSLIQCCEQGMRTEFKVLLIEAFTVSNLRWIIEMESKRNVHCYNPPKDHKVLLSWQETKRVSSVTAIQKRRPPGPTVIFFAGGYLRRSLDVLECYDPLTLTWSILPPLSVPKSGLGAAYFGM